MDQDELVKEIVKANAQETYKDAAQPAIRVVGKSLAQCMSLFMTPVGRMAEIAENNIHKYIDKIDKINPSSLVPPETRILVPVLEKLRYTEDDKVVEYYTQILATASTKEHRNKVMAAFIEILNRLTADELRILEKIHSDIILNINPITDEESKIFGLSIGQNTILLKNTIPILSVNLYTEGRPDFRNIKRNYSNIIDYVNVNVPENLESYFDNMASLGLIQIDFNNKLAIQKIYESLKNNKVVLELKKHLGEGQRLEFAEGNIDISNLGIKLLEICSSNSEK